MNILRRAAGVKTPISRRSLLTRMGAGALALTLPIWKHMEARAQAAVPQKRLFTFFTPNGTVPDQFFPAPGSNMVLPPLLAPLEAFKQKMLVIKGVHMHSTIGDNKPGGPHMKGPGAMLTGGWLLEGSFTGAGGPAGYANNISVDQALAPVISNDTAFPSLEFGVAISGQEPLRVVSYRGSNQPNDPIDNPWTMFDRVFANVVPDDTERERLVAERSSVLDYVKEELTTLNGQLPAEDRPRLEAHLDGVRNIEKQLAALGNECVVPAIGDPIDHKAKENYPAIGKLQMDMMFYAHTCDVTRVSSFMWSNADSWQYFPWIGVDEEHHALSHLTDAASIEKLVKINVWYAEQMAYFLGLLEGVTEADGKTMLDNSLVLWGNEIGEGATHTYENIPWVLAGSCGGHFATGRSLQYEGEPHNNLMLSVLHAFGMTDQTSFGAPENCTGPLAGLTV
ncbi:MAG TPA: DUF1552 domain-containing protein [Polyangiaceae bacterium]|nr:DUF1552 domain-containing protein [Polyangiaceae bacterium]